MSGGGRGLVEAAEACLPLLEKIEDASLVGDEGCLWPVEGLRAALAQTRSEPQRLSQDHVYALALIAEECGEAIQLIGKALCFGFDTPGAPESPFNGETARTNLPKELGDIRAAIRFAAAHGLVDEDQVLIAEHRKLAKLCNPDSKDNLGRPLAPMPPSTPS